MKFAARVMPPEATHDEVVELAIAINRFLGAQGATLSGGVSALATLLAHACLDADDPVAEARRMSFAICDLVTRSLRASEAEGRS